MQAGQAKQEDRRRGQRGLFDDYEAESHSSLNGKGNGAASGSNLPDIPELPDVERLAGEKKALGFYMSSHPLARHAQLLQALATHQVEDLAGLPDKAEVILGGMLRNIQIRNVQKSRSGLTRMAKLTVEDLTGSTPAMLWPEEFDKSADLVKNDDIVFVKGTLSRQREPAELIISRIIPLANGPAELTKGVVIRLSKGLHQPEHLEKLLRAIRIRPGGLELYLEIVGLENVRRAIFRAGSSLRIRHDEKLIADLEIAVGEGNVRLLGQRGTTTRVAPLAARPSPSKTLVAVSSGGFASHEESDDMDEDD
jgi:DNA polymerase-3 subunit alpha